jgi:hypothetical protein
MLFKIVPTEYIFILFGRVTAFPEATAFETFIEE